MVIGLVVVLIVVVAAVYFVVPYYITRGFTSHRFARFVPAFLALATSGVLALKGIYFSVGFAGMPYYMLGIVFFWAAVVLSVAGLIIPLIVRGNPRP